MSAPYQPRPLNCPRCDRESRCVHWVEVDIGVGVQVGDEMYECPECGPWGYVRKCDISEARKVAEDMREEGRHDEARRALAAALESVPVFQYEARS